MIKNKFFIFIILVLALISIGVASAQDSSSLNTTGVDVSTSSIDTKVIADSDVNNSREDVNSQLQSYEVIKDSNDVKTFSDLQKEIDDKSDNSVLDLNSNYVYSGTSDFAGITITKNNFTIDGHGHTLDANAGSKQVRIFFVTGSNITIKNLIFINGNINSGSGLGGSGGSAIWNSGLYFTIINSTFTNNKANAGGAIYNNYYSDNFMIINSTFTSNSAKYGGVMENYGANFMIINSNFTSNKATENGGVLNNFGTNFMIINSNFTSNSATCGGALRNAQKGFTCINSTFASNTANQGTAIFNVIVGSYNDVSINLTNNKYSGISNGKTYIYNTGSIITPVTITVLGNSTIKKESGEKVVLFATITTEDGASVAGGTLKFIVNDTTQTTSATSNDNGNYTLSYTVPNAEGRYLVDANYGNANDVATQTGIINVGKLYDVYVDYNNGDNKRDGSSWINAVKTIEYAMEIVHEGGIIHLADGTHIVDTQIAINKLVTIMGNTTKALITNKGNGVFKVNVNGVNIQSCTFINNTGEYGGAIENYAKNLIISNNVFTADDCVAIYNSADSTINLTNNKYSGISADKTYIYNLGTIITPTIITVLGNTTINSQYGEKILLFATITTEDGGSVTGQTLTFNINNTQYPANINNDGNYTYNNLPVDFIGIKTVDATYNGANDLTVQIGTINSSKITTKVDIKVDESIDYGENAAIKINVTKGASGSVTVSVDGKEYETLVLINSEANLNITGLSAGKHTITVKYNGGDLYNASSNDATVTVNSVAPTITIESSQLVYGEKGTITVTVNKHLNGTIPTGNVTISVGGKTQDVKLVNGVATLSVYGLTGGEHNVEVTYNSDNKNYTTNSNSTLVDVGKASSKVDVNVNQVVYGENATIKVNITKGATGNVTITIDNKKYDPVKLNNGEATLIVSNLTGGNHKIDVTYNGDNNYKTSNKATSFNIARANPAMEIKVLGDVQSNSNIPISVILPSDATGYVNITVGNKNYFNEAIVNGSVNITVDYLAYGTYKINASYAGDNNYNAAKANSTVFVPKIADYKMNITVNPTNPILGDDVTINVNLPKNATGEVVISVNGKNYTAPVNNGVATIAIANIAAGEYDVVANYSGDNQYVAKNATTSFNVSKISSKVNITINEIVYGENATIKVNVTPGATGNVTITIDNEKYNPIKLNNNEAVLVVSGLDAGEHKVDVTYNGDSNYETSSANKTLNIAQATPTITIGSSKLVYGGDGTITVTVNKHLNGVVPTGSVTISVGGKTQDVKLVNGVANFSVSGLTGGEHNVEVTYNSDNKNYKSTSNSTLINVGKTSSKVDITVNNIVYGENASIKVNITPGATGNVTIKVDNEEYDSINLVNGKVTLDVSGLSAGEHKVEVTYNGDNNYNTSSNSATINVDQATPTITIDTTDVVYGGEGTLIVTVNKHLNGVVPTGSVTISVGGKKQDVKLVNGVASLDVSSLNVGQHTVEVTYNSDNKNYKSTSNSTSFNISMVSSKVDVTVNNIVYGENATIKVNVTKGATGNVTITVDNKKYDPINLDNSVAVLIVSGLSAGEHKVDVTYNGDNKYKASNNTGTFNIAKANATMEIKVLGDVQSNSNIPISVVLPSDATGYVNITLGDKKYLNEAIVNGSVNITVNYLDYGTYKINASYSGDSNYNVAIANSSVFVPKIGDYKMNITVNPNNPILGDDVTINVNLPKNATGKVIITVDGKDYTVLVDNGVAKVTIANVSVGKHNVVAKYSGDNQYVAKNATTSFNVEKASSKVDVNVNNIVYGENATIKVNVTKGATGYVTITIDNKKYDSVKLNTGEGVLIVSGLTGGVHKVDVTYNGDSNYKASNNAASFNIAKANATMEIKVLGDVQNNVNIPISVILPSDATGYVNITVGNKKYLNQAIVGGSVNITIDYLDYGTYDITALYGGDDNYNTAVANATVFVPKVDDYQMNITVNPNNPVLGDDVVINVNLPKNATGEVIISVGGKNYTVDVVDGVANVTINNIDAGEYNIIANYSGDNQYVAKNTTTSFNVDKGNATLVVKIADIKVGEAINITATLTGINDTKLNGTVSVTINNKVYTIVVIDGIGSKIGDIFNKSGNNDFIANWTGDNNYNPAEDYGVFEVSKITDYEMNVTIPEDNKVGKNITITVDLPDDATGNVTVIINNKNHTAPVKNGTAIIIIPGLPEGNHNVTINYTGDDKYAPNSKNDTIKVSKISDFNMTAKVDDSKVGENVNIRVTLPDDAKGDVSIVIGGKSYNATVKDGSAVIIVPGLSAGNYTGTVVYSGDDKYTNNSADVAFKVSKVSDYDMNVTIPEETKEGENTTIIVDLPDGATGNVTVIVNGKNYTVPVKNGTAIIIIPDLPEGDHNVTIDYSGDDKYEPTTTNKTIIVTSNGVNLTASDVVMIYKDGSRLYATLLNSKGSPIANATIFFTINGITYNRTTNANGSASLAINLDYGVYNAVISYDENTTVNATVEVKSSIIGNDLVKMWMNDTQFYATFLGKGATPLANTNVTFNINGVFYTRQTNENGTAKLNINLRPGSYILTAYNPVSGEQRGFNVLVKSLIETSDLTKYYNNASKFEAKIYNKDGSLAVNKAVTFNIHGVFYTRTSDANGIVKLSITLRPGDYIITSMYEGLDIGNNVKVIPTLETSDLFMTQDDGSVFKVRTLDGQGSPLANQEITFNIHGVFYHKTTDGNGVANLNINLMKGEYIITSYWNDYEIGNKIEVL